MKTKERTHTLSLQQNLLSLHSVKVTVDEHPFRLSVRGNKCQKVCCSLSNSIHFYKNMLHTDLTCATFPEIHM